MDSVVCSGNESSILDCQYDGVGNGSCNHRNDVGVQCLGIEDFAVRFPLISISLFSILGPCVNGTIRLVEKVSEKEGAVEICINNLWHTLLVSKDLNGLQEASVICSQLGYSPFGKNILQVCA